MPSSTQEEKSLLGMAGEFLVAAELNRRNIHAAVTYGSSKAADVYAFGNDAAHSARVEVKATPARNKKWLVGHKALQKENRRSNWLWVFVLLPQPAPRDAPTSDHARGVHSPRFFVLTSTEVGLILEREHAAYLTKYRARHNKEFSARGVPQLPFKAAEPHENRWDKIALIVNGKG